MVEMFKHIDWSSPTFCARCKKTSGSQLDLQPSQVSRGFLRFWGGDFSWPPSKTPCLLAWWVVTKDDATATCSQRPSRKRPRRVSRPDGRSKMKNRAMWNNLKEWHCGVLAFSEWQLTKFTRAESFTCFWFLSYLHASQPGTIPMLWWISINLEPFITTLSLSLSLVPSFLTFHSKSMIFLK